MPAKQIFPLVALFGAALLYSSCGGDKPGEETVKTDSTQTAIVFDPAVEKILPLFKEGNELPYKTDTAFLHHADGDSLGSDQVKLLAGNWFKHDLTTSVSGQLDDFYAIDSVKATGKYKEWCEGLDIGMTKFANADALNKIQLDEKTWILTWAMTISSYEACPYFSGTNIYATIVYEGKVTQTFVLGEETGAGDPPVSMNTLLTSELTADGKLALHGFEENDDMDAEFSTQVKNEYWFEIKDGKFNLVKEEKGKETQVAHPVETSQE